MHKNHLVGCGVGVVLALALVTFTGGSAGSLGVLAVALICPIAMVAAMYFLMGHAPADRNVDHEEPRQVRP
jgi:hypothetical protein